MKLDNKTALGIDISQGRISMALLRRKGSSVELVKAASGPVPEGAIKNGNIEDPVMLAKGIKELKAHSKIRIRLRQAAVSLIAKPMLVQIIDAPKQFPTNVGQFIQNELKHCVALSGKKIAMDFCGITSAGRSGGSRLFVVASDSQKVADLVKACNMARVNLEVVEPELLAFARALYAKKIARKFDHNVLIAMLQDKALTLCVFKKQMLDFVRARDIGQDKPDTGDLCQRLAEEINTVIQFYNIEVPDSTINWEITIFTDGEQLPKDAEEALLAKIAVPPQIDVQVRGLENICKDISVTEKGGLIKTAASAVAIGLAMKFLVPDGSNLRINLLPPEATEVKSLKRHALIIANIIAAVLFIMVLVIGALMFKIERVNEDITRKKKGQSLQQISELLQEDQILDRRTKQLSEGPGRLKEIIGSRRESSWLGLLNDLRSRAPKTVRITNLTSKGDSAMFLEGLALSYEAVHLFVNMLDQSEYVTSASLIEAEKDNEDGYIKYAISCSITSKEGELTGAH